MRKKVKLIVLDLDGTTLKNNGELHPDNLKALTKIYKEHPEIKVVIATGRATTRTIKLAKACKIPENSGYMICYNGGSVINITREKQQEEYRKVLSDTEIQNIISFAKINNLHLELFATEDQGFYINNGPLPKSLIERFNKKELKELKPTDKLPTSYKVILYCKNQNQTSEMIEKLKASSTFSLSVSSDIMLEINPANINKSTAVQFLCEKWNIQSEEVLACGDAMNDQEIIQFSGYGVAMGNASVELKRTANYVTDTNENGGVAKAIEKHVFEQEKIRKQEIRRIVITRIYEQSEQLQTVEFVQLA